MFCLSRTLKYISGLGLQITCYSCMSNIRDALINKHAQSIVYSATNKHHAYSLLECTTIVYIGMCTFINSQIGTEVDSYRYSDIAINMHRHNTVFSSLEQETQDGVRCKRSQLGRWKHSAYLHVFVWLFCLLTA